MNNESNDLNALRETASKAMIELLWLHILIGVTIGMARGTDWLLPAAVLLAFAAAATACWRLTGNGLATRLTVALALMGGVAMFTFQFAGHPWQIDTHMYFFAALACLVAYCDYRPIVVAALAVASHHLVLNFILPAAVFPGGKDLERVILHALILFVEAGVLVWLALRLSSLFAMTEQKTAEAREAHAAQALASAERVKAEERIKQESHGAMRQLTAEFERKVTHVIEAVATAAGEMQEMSSSMSNTSEETARQSAAAAAASTQASVNVGTVASATEELTASIGEIGHQVTRCAEIAGKAADEARRTNSVVEGLVTRTRKIDEVVALIQNIASQTNLLALNATIEAARAGEHGRGFAVVASEVKALANQTAKATEEISAQIHGIQTATGQAVEAIQAIGGTIDEINNISNAIASAVDQQGAATHEIAGNVQQAANGTSEANENILSVTEAFSEAGRAASRLLGAANGLSTQSEQLKAEVDSFLASVRAA
jgi:methyl-accepting chemotaxis protein